MIGRPLMTQDELKALPKGHFILAKTGCHPMRTELRLFFKWGIVFENEYEMEQHVARPVYYADRLELEQEILRRQFEGDIEEFDEPEEFPPAAGGGLGHKPMFKCQTEPEEHKLPLRTD